MNWLVKYYPLVMFRAAMLGLVRPSHLMNHRARFMSSLGVLDNRSGLVLIGIPPGGLVELIDVMPQTGSCDARIASSARVSYSRDGAAPKPADAAKDAQLINYLMRHRHTSPFEMVEFMFRIKMTIAAARQMVRHRTASINEVSLRYTEASCEFGLPDEFHYGYGASKQSSGDTVHPISASLVRLAQDAVEDARDTYNSLLTSGVPREEARAVLPVAQYTEFIWKCDLHNIMHFLKLRMDHTAQSEIRHVAGAIYDLVKPRAPATIAAWENHVLNAVTFSAAERQICNENPIIGPTHLAGLSPGERVEFASKIKKMGFEMHLFGGDC